MTIFVSTGKQKVKVPDVRHLTLNEAIARLNDVHLNPQVHELFSSAPVSTVIAQAPEPGESVLANSSVRLNVSQGPKLIPVPNVVGTPFPNAQSALEGAGFVVVRSDEASDQPKGEVTATDPQGGTSSRQGTKVTVTVSKGPATTQIPDVRGQSQANAESLLAQAGLTPSVVFQPVTDPSQDGIVLDQNPAPGGDAKSGEIIIVTVGQIQNGTPGGDNPPTTTTTTTTTATTATTTTTTP